MSSKKTSDKKPQQGITRPSLTDRVALVTGGSRGIGLAIAKSLVLHGAKVVITGRDERALGDAAAEIARAGGESVTKYCDVRSADSVAELFTAIRDQFQQLDILVNNAGVAGPNATVDELTIEEWLEVVQTNLTGTFLVTHAAIPLLRRGGIIVNNLSVAAKGAFPGMSAYVASKHGALGFTLTLREELRPRGVRVLALMPGATNTEIWKQFWPEAPRGRMMSADSVAEALTSAILLPESTSIDELLITPAEGAL